MMWQRVRAQEEKACYVLVLCLILIISPQSRDCLTDLYSCLIPFTDKKAETPFYRNQNVCTCPAPSHFSASRLGRALDHLSQAAEAETPVKEQSQKEVLP